MGKGASATRKRRLRNILGGTAKVNDDYLGGVRHAGGKRDREKKAPGEKTS